MQETDNVRCGGNQSRVVKDSLAEEVTFKLKSGGNNKG